MGIALANFDPMQFIRSFLAIPVPAAIQKSVASAVQRLQHPGDGMKWVPSDNLHLTLKFLGDVDNRQVPQICAITRACVAGIIPFEVLFQGISAFPDPARPRVVYAAIVDGGEPLKRIVMRLEERLAEVGFKPEPRDYIPHMTLARTRGGSRRGSPELAAAITTQGNRKLGSMLVDRVLVMASFLDKEGPTYQVMDTILLSDS